MVPHDGDDDDREDRAAILARRSVFIVSAVAGIGLAACAEPTPRACLNVVEAPTTTESAPQPCLSPPMPEPEPDAGVPATDAGTTDAGPNR